MAAPHNDNTKEKILQCATELLEKKSFNDVSLAEIAKASGISKGSVYYYYKSKDEILYDIADGYLELLYHDLMIWIEDEDKDTSLPRVLRYVLERGVDDPSKSLRLHLTMDGISGNETIRKKLLARYQVFRDVIGEKISDRKGDGKNQFYGLLMLTLVDGLMIQNLLGNETLNLDEFIDDFIDMLA